MQNLDLWLDFVDTREIIPLFEKNAKEYNIPNLKEVDWSKEPEQVIQIAKERNFSVFNTMESGTQYHYMFSWLWEKGEKELLLKCFKYPFAKLKDCESSSALTLTMIQSMLDFLKQAPFLSLVFIEIDLWDSLCPDIYKLLENAGLNILEAYVLSANEMQDFVVEPFKKVISQLQFMSLTNFEGLIELISLTVRSVDIALDLLLECLEPESSRILLGHPALIQQFVRNILGIALDHIDEAVQSQSPEEYLLDLKVIASESGGYPIVESRLRIDAPEGILATADHVRLTIANPPANSPMAQVYSIDALVEPSQPGSITFRCFHPVPPFVEQCSWELQKCGSFVTTKTMFDAVHALATREDCCGISNQILGTQTETCPPANPPLVGYIATSDLNTSQNLAVEACLRYPLTFLWGPPGTGKTHTIVRIIKQLQKSSGIKRILVTAPTHNAVDNVMRNYLSSGTAGGQIDIMESNTIRVSTDVRKVAEDLKQYTCDAMVGKEIYTSYASLNKARDRIKKCLLVFTTCIGAGLGLLRSELFDTVIIDEASQQTEPASLVPLVKGCKKAILVGDHVQLGATVQRHAVLQQFDISLFERLYKQELSTEAHSSE